MSRGYTPDAGDIVWITFDPQAGHEQAGHRPALVLTPAGYNASSGLMIACPMTSRIKPYPFVVVVSESPPSVVLADQAKSMDWRKRGAIFKEKAPTALLVAVKAKLGTLLGF